MRFILAALILSPVLFIEETSKSLSLPRVVHSSLLGVLLLIGGLLPVAYAEKTIPSNIVAIIIGCAPMAFAAFDRLLNGTRIRLNTVLGSVLGLVGVSLLSAHGSSNVASAVTPIGLLLVILGCCTWSFASVLSRKLRPVSHPLAHIFFQYLASGVILIFTSLLFESLSLQSLAGCSRASWLSLIYITLFPSLVSYSAYMWLLKNEPSHRVSTYALVNPAIAVIVGALILGEPASLDVLAALGFVVGGTWLNFRTRSVV